MYANSIIIQSHTNEINAKGKALIRIHSFSYKNIVSSTEAKYSYISANLRPEMFLSAFLDFSE